LLALDDPSFRALFTKSPIKRIGRDRFIRNVLHAAGNSGDPSLAAQVEALIHDPAPVVRGTAIWALRKLAPQRAEALKALFLDTESDETVKAEWRA